MEAADDQEADYDARITRTGFYGAWLKKVKSENARFKWFSPSTTRYFAIDFDDQVFYYAHTEATIEVTRAHAEVAIPFKDIINATLLPPNFGFVVYTRDRNYELYSTNNADAAQWVYALNAARELGKLGKGGPPVGEPDQGAERAPGSSSAPRSEDPPVAEREIEPPQVTLEPVLEKTDAAAAPPPEERQEAAGVAPGIGHNHADAPAAGAVVPQKGAPPSGCLSFVPEICSGFYVSKSWAKVLSMTRRK